MSRATASSSARVSAWHEGKDGGGREGGPEAHEGGAVGISLDVHLPSPAARQYVGWDARRGVTPARQILQHLLA